MSKVLIIAPHLFEKAMHCEITKTRYEVIKHNIYQIDKKVDFLRDELNRIPSALFLARESVIVHMEILESKRNMKMSEMEHLFDDFENKVEDRGYDEDYANTYRDDC
ncbi:hypothetical protein WMW72_05995 [Paenibacillus filicis]|uniref:Cell division protein ZapA n=1 Tax=Paenibacillus filicis TaxID=669464 RepID=A0ABU9DF28_9BACL